MRNKIKFGLLCISTLMVGWFITAFAIAFIVYIGWRLMSTETIATFMAYELLHSLISINGVISIFVLTVAYFILLIIDE